jgi:uncharacterized protein with NRDE domain
MCFLVFGYQTHPRYRLVFASNRDEFYERPTAPAAFWDDAPDVLAGRDLKGGGTWMGMTRTGRFAALTNHRDLRNLKNDAPTRGDLVANFLTGEQAPRSYLEQVEPVAGQYNGFNLLVGDTADLYSFSNVDPFIRKLSSGIYGLSNAVLNTPWPKVARGKERLQAILEAEDIDTDALMDLLSDTQTAPDEQLPDTGIGGEWEHLLSSIFIESETYGTRASTIVLIDYEDHVTFIERVSGPDAEGQPVQRFSFAVGAEQAKTSAL